MICLVYFACPLLDLPHLHDFVALWCAMKLEGTGKRVGAKTGSRVEGEHHEDEDRGEATA